MIGSISYIKMKIIEVFNESKHADLLCPTCDMIMYNVGVTPDGDKIYNAVTLRICDKCNIPFSIYTCDNEHFFIVCTECDEK